MSVIVFFGISCDLTKSDKTVFNKIILDDNLLVLPDDSFTLSPDNRILVKMNPSNDPFVVYDLDRSRKIGVELRGNFETWGYSAPSLIWKNDSELHVINKFPKAYYYLEVNTDSAVAGRYSNLEDHDENYSQQASGFSYNLILGDIESIKKELKRAYPGFKFKEESGLTIHYRDRMIARHFQRTALLGPQKPYLQAVSFPFFIGARSYIFYVVSWNGGTWNNGPKYLYCFSTADNKVSLIDREFTIGLMLWTSDCKKFIYISKTQGYGFKLNEILLPDADNPASLGRQRFLDKTNFQPNQGQGFTEDKENIKERYQTFPDSNI